MLTQTLGAREKRWNEVMNSTLSEFEVFVIPVFLSLKSSIRVVIVLINFLAGAGMEDSPAVLCHDAPSWTMKVVPRVWKNIMIAMSRCNADVDGDLFHIDSANSNHTMFGRDDIPFTTRSSFIMHYPHPLLSPNKIPFASSSSSHAFLLPANTFSIHS
ncbi:hypothetical protein BDY19DRAFT_635271 [Irpex rosettiformis]|uniref:Uncharacterized protein n=1 Tax=Irpex rosettiformis TaxID=378272 RepID=A0ACB8UBP3_9APHY|nr:hypothetical protein BDY19DRAFT_635271 [Irpex rosettiformis]